MSAKCTAFARLSYGLAAAAVLMLAACAGGSELPAASMAEAAPSSTYRIGPKDMLRIVVWQNPGLSDTVPVRPDGRVSIPLLDDVEAINKTPAELAREIEKKLGAFVQDPLVTIVVTEFAAPPTQQVRVIGSVTKPSAIPFRANMTLLDVMIEVEGLTEFASGNQSSLVRMVDGEQKRFRVRVSDLVRDGDVTANVVMLPGDVLMVPESFF